MPPHRQQRKFSELSCVTARDGSVVKRGTIVRVDTAAGRRVALVRRLFTRDWDRPHDRGQAHVHQGYTLGNTSRALGHPLNTEVFTVLKEVEHVKPDVCLIENVPGIATPFPCGTNVLEQVVQRLLSLGYQVRLGQLNSRNYGSPQNRHRIFILAVRSGLPLPAWPAPTHAHGRRKLNLSLGGEPIVLGGNSGADTTRALRPAVTARDAIGDFPEWDYSVLDDRAPNTAARGFDFGDRVGLSDGTPYRCRPKTSYQRAARGGERGEETGVKDHLTSVFSAPKANEPYIGPGNILRCNPHRAVPTIQSNPFPGRNSTLTIHWMSHRVLSVAERRRIQGLPDSYILRGPVKEKDRMLGNMVDVHVADALAAHIKREVFAPSWLAWGRPARDEFWRMWRAAHPV
ncbi:S-adenosyl-L-methionine-dependent methyltransferase [Cutaneotrichosporon oleaginosum]|uniref:DNA (cytosine-5-)-methyltransferase n=1 Tax=Cutaneotrichosporon oleaginosum TaxID=879819 RepID=A0A0J0XWT0_9TREE|nr:S-adenosyl-L-methionine-dependent methyltransferase [Cutaneotrichosporon oleaginosum]KLT45503.1 S-adenosyl-L-methionine-dependent methyltransferase [Cutaneotrichosporon oleaginosum]TXT14542.1 hypothetical protein COLE_00735 [Cutaneotrichosporon oleaginosum]